VLCDDYFFTMHAARARGGAAPATGSSTLALALAVATS
jgi:hypothetical protein